MCHRCDKKKQTPVKGAFHKGRLGHETSMVHRCDKNRCEKKNHLEQRDFIKDFLKTVKIDNASSVIYF